MGRNLHAYLFGYSSEGEVTCTDCPAPCCQHVTIEIDKPKSREGWDNIRWFTAHRHVAVLQEGKEWLLEFQAPCIFHSEAGCQIYGKRPRICREYNIENCEKNGTDHLRFSSPEQVKQHLRTKGKNWW